MGPIGRHIAVIVQPVDRAGVQAEGHQSSSGRQPYITSKRKAGRGAAKTSSTLDPCCGHQELGAPAGSGLVQATNSAIAPSAPHRAGGEANKGCSSLAARAPARTGQVEWGMEVLEHVGDGVRGSAKSERLGYFQLAQNYATI